MFDKFEMIIEMIIERFRDGHVDFEQRAGSMEGGRWKGWGGMEVMEVATWTPFFFRVSF